MFAAPASGSPGPASAESTLAPGAVGLRDRLATVLAEENGAETVIDEDEECVEEQPQWDPVLDAGGTPTANEVRRFSDFALQELMKSVKPFGGPKAWIWSNLQSPQKLESYLQWLWITFPEKECLLPHQEGVPEHDPLHRCA